MVTNFNNNKINLTSFVHATTYSNERHKTKTSLFSPLFSTIKSHIVYYPTAQHLYYAWSIGSLLGIMLVIQVITGVLLAMHYTPHVDLAFDSVERIMREVPAGWFLRYLHSNGSSMIFILMYLHIARGLYYQSYRAPKQWVWLSGSIIFILMSAVAFLGYTLPWGQMSFWGATVITNIITAIPILGTHIVNWIWGGFSVNNNTLNRFFSLHFFLSIILLALSLLHLIFLHEVGSTSVPGRTLSLDLTKFFPYFFLKDMFSLLVFLFFYLIIVFYKPNLFGHPDNYVRASAIVTPAHIVPEWYFLPFYAILKSLPSKLGGAICMLASMLVLFILPWWCENYSVTIDPSFKPFWDFLFIIFISIVAVLGLLGSKALAGPTLLVSQILTGLYFAYFILIIPIYNWFVAQNEKALILARLQADIE